MRQTLVELVIFVVFAGVTLAHRLVMSNIHLNWPSCVTPNRIAPWLNNFKLSASGVSAAIEVSPDPQKDSQVIFTRQEIPIEEPAKEAPAFAGVYIVKNSGITALVEDRNVRLEDGDFVVMVVPAPAGFEGLVELLPTSDFIEKTMEMFVMNKKIPRGVLVAQIMTDQKAFNKHESFNVVGQSIPKADK